jgi:hypothetical protein
MRLKDHREGVFLEVINQLEAQVKKIAPMLKGYIYVAIMAIETVLVFGYGRTKEEINQLRQLS